MGKSIALAILFVLLLMGISFRYYVTSLPDLESPLTIGEVSLLSDGGSIAASFRDSQGNEFYFGIRGDLESDQQFYPLYYIRNPKAVPYVYWPAISGADEKAFLRFLDNWIQRNIEPRVRKKLDQHDIDGLRQTEMEEAAIYRIYELLRDRNKV